MSNDGRLLVNYAVRPGEMVRDIEGPGEADLAVILDGVKSHLNVAVQDIPYRLSVGPGGRRIAFSSQGEDDKDYFPDYRVTGIYILDIAYPDDPILLLADAEIRDGISSFAWSEATGRLAISTVYTPGRGDVILISEPVSLELLDQFSEHR